MIMNATQPMPSTRVHVQIERMAREIANRIKWRQKDLRLSNKQAAKRCGMSVRTYAYYKGGSFQLPDAEKLRQIEEGLEVDLGYLSDEEAEALLHKFNSNS